jgi:ABC-type multidrug transport system ATPase subunit
MLQFKDIYKSYEGNKALKGISFDVKKGELFGLIGPDGAGKSTLFRILTTVLLADSGTALFNGYDVVDDYKYIRKNVGYMPGKFSLYQDLSVKENLNFFATIFNTSIEENYDLIKDIYQQLEPFEDRRAGALSGGMKQKLALSCALIHKPMVLVLDEPTFGVDAVSRKEFWDMLKILKEKGVTIIVSTPYMDEASLCDRVALIQKGEILQIDTPNGIIQSFEKIIYTIKTDKIYKTLNVLEEIKEVNNAFSFGQEIHVYSENELNVEEIVRKLDENGIDEVNIEKGEPTIEDCFMDLMVSQKLEEDGIDG